MFILMDSATYSRYLDGLLTHLQTSLRIYKYSSVHDPSRCPCLQAQPSSRAAHPCGEAAGCALEPGTRGSLGDTHRRQQGWGHVGSVRDTNTTSFILLPRLRKTRRTTENTRKFWRAGREKLEKVQPSLARR